MPYDIYCDFDMEKHKKTYINYLDVLILQDGKIVYAVPSHQEKAIDLCCEKLNVTRKELDTMCPRKYWCDYTTWLLNICGAIAVWNNQYAAGESGLNARQRAALRRLKLNGLYRGKVL